MVASGDDELWSFEPRLVELHLIAARESGRMPEVAGKVSAFVAASDMEPTMKFVAMREFLVVDDTASTWTILARDERLRSHPLFLKTAGRVVAQSKSKTEKAEVRAFLRRTFGDPVPSARSDIGYQLPATRADLGPPKPLRLVWSRGVDPIHAEQWAATESTFRRSMERGKPPHLVEYRNVFVDPVGQMWTEEGRVVKSKGAPINTVPRSEVRTVPLAFNALGATKGIFHWLTDRFVNASFLLDRAADDVIVLLRRSAPAFEAASLALGGVGSDRIHFMDQPVFCERLLIARVGFPGLRWWGGNAPIAIAAAARASEIAKASGFRPPRRLYISRRDAVRRSIEGEAGLEASLAARGFEPLLFSQIPLEQQIAAAMSADVIVAPHGAGLSHLLFAAPTARIVELLPVSRGTHHLRFNYAKLSIMRNLDYRAWIEQPPVNAARWQPDFRSFLKVVDEALT